MGGLTAAAPAPAAPFLGGGVGGGVGSAAARQARFEAVAGERRVAVVGDRGLHDLRAVVRRVAALRRHHGDKLLVLHQQAGARGAGWAAERAAEQVGARARGYRADWERDGAAAAHRRDEALLADAHEVVAFTGGEDPYVERFVGEAAARGLPLEIVPDNRAAVDDPGPVVVSTLLPLPGYWPVMLHHYPKEVGRELEPDAYVNVPPPARLVRVPGDPEPAVLELAVPEHWLRGFPVGVAQRLVEERVRRVEVEWMTGEHRRRTRYAFKDWLEAAAMDSSTGWLVAPWGVVPFPPPIPRPKQSTAALAAIAAAKRRRWRHPDADDGVPHEDQVNPGWGPEHEEAWRKARSTLDGYGQPGAW